MLPNAVVGKYCPALYRITRYHSRSTWYHSGKSVVSKNPAELTASGNWPLDFLKHFIWNSVPRSESSFLRKGPNLSRNDPKISAWALRLVEVCCQTSMNLIHVFSLSRGVPWGSVQRAGLLRQQCWWREGAWQGPRTSTRISSTQRTCCGIYWRTTCGQREKVPGWVM